MAYLRVADFSGGANCDNNESGTLYVAAAVRCRLYYWPAYIV